VKSFLFIRLTPLFIGLALLGCTKDAEPLATVVSPPVVYDQVEHAVESNHTEVVQELAKPSTLETRFSYTYGYMLYNTLLHQQGFGDLDASYFAKGALDAAAGSGFFTQDEMQQTLYEVQTQLLQIAQQEVEALAAENLEMAEAFLAINSTEREVETTASGLQYRILIEGVGEQPTLDAVIELDYRLMLLNGRVVDSSWDRGKSVTLQLKNVTVPGFVEGVELMRPGSQYRFWLHPSLAYGKEGTQLIEPNTLLVAEVTLHSVNGAQ
jgi:FKBP-type peptidyl-prolyl cis-trans isomerase FkpA